MAHRSLNLLQSVSRLAHELDDAEMLRRFVAHRDATAFEVLVWRHGPAVHAACRRMLHDRHLAEDALQATFLLLSQKAGTIREGHKLAGWLHRTACRVCWRAAKIRQPEALMHDPPAPTSTKSEPDTAAILDAEVNCLPEKLRHVVVLCYLEDRSADEAAKRLGIPRGTVLSRLATARAKLAVRLTKQGLAPVLAVAIVSDRLSAELVQQCVTIGCQLKPAVATVPFLLAQGVIQMSLRKLVLAWSLAIVSVAGIGTGVAVVATAGDEPGKPVEATDKTLPKSKPPITVTDDLHGTWELVAISEDGNKGLPNPNTITFDKDHVYYSGSQLKLRWISTKVGNKYQLTTFNQDHLMLMIYELNNETLKTGMYLRSNPHRPTSFDLKDKLEGETLIIATYKRIAPPPAKADEKPDAKKLDEERQELLHLSATNTASYDKTFTQQEQLEAELRLAERTTPPSILIQSKQAVLAAVEQELVKAEVKLIETEERKKALGESGMKQLTGFETISIVVQPNIVAHLREQRAILHAELLKETQPSPEAQRINDEFRKLIEQRQKLAVEMKELSERRRSISDQLETLPK